MPDRTLLKEKLEQVRDALLRIQKRFSDIKKPEDFHSDEASVDKLDAIAMMLIAIGETFKKIDKETDGHLLKRFPQIDWKGIKGVRDVIAHDYFEIDIEDIYQICQHDIAPLLETVDTMLKEL